MGVITINGNSLDPSAPTLRALNLSQETAKGSDYILIQAEAPLTKEIKKELAEKQVEIQEKVSEHTYLCHYKPQDLSEIRQLPYVSYVNIYQPHFVIESRLKTVPAGSSATHPLLPAPARTEHPVNVDVEFHQGVVETPELTNAFANAARLDPATLRTDGHKTQVIVQRRYLSDVAELDQVKSINQVHPAKLHNNVARGVLRLGEAVHPGQADTRYEGEGEIVCVADSGFDKGSLDPGDVPDAFKFRDAVTGQPVVRVDALYALGRQNNNCSDPDGHGTHGAAPKATLVMQSLLDPLGGLGGIPSDLGQLFNTPYTTVYKDQEKARRCRIHTNSWGSGSLPFSQIEYNSPSRAIDHFVNKNRDMVILFAAGNDGMDIAPREGVVDLSQVGAEAAAKNCISVGASESYRPKIDLSYSSFGFPKQPLGSDKVANDPRGMAAFSSRGPTREGRVKARRRRAGDLHPLDAQLSREDVAGCCAVVRETLVKNGTPRPSAALVKALLINGAVELVGQYVPTEAGKSPNNASGWGRVDVPNSIVIGRLDQTTGVMATADKTAGFRDESGPLDTFEQFDFEIPITEAGRTLKTTLVWTDPAGPELQNDLDLIVIALDRGIERHGNQQAQDLPRNAEEPFDRKNNVEQIVWKVVPEGKAMVVVRGHNVSSMNGQTFALAWKVY
ncbi:hypothetical protein N0V88_003231 [Collariella sp. IMI 366227]|nr:hypothetical protein N0V88_003231 [Collariella sp. IMI 366227]